MRLLERYLSSWCRSAAQQHRQQSSLEMRQLFRLQALHQLCSPEACCPDEAGSSLHLHQRPCL